MGIQWVAVTRIILTPRNPLKNQWLEGWKIKKSYLGGKFPESSGAKCRFFSGGHPPVRSDGICGRVILSSVETSFNEPNDLK